MYILDCSMSFHDLIAHFFVAWTSIPSSACNTVSSHNKRHFGFSQFWRLWISSKHLCAFFVSEYQGVWLLDHMVWVCLVFCKKLPSCFQSSCAIFHSHQQWARVASFCICIFACVSVLESSWSNRYIILFICVFLKTWIVKHLSVYCMFFGEMSVQVFGSLQIKPFLNCWALWVLCIFWIIFLLSVYISRYFFFQFSEFMVCSLAFLAVSFSYSRNSEF